MKKLSLAIVCLSYISIYTSESPQNNTATLALLELCKTTIVDQGDKSEINDLLNGNKFDKNKKINIAGLARFTLSKQDDCLYIDTFGDKYPGYASLFFDWCKKKELFKNIQGNKLDAYTSKDENAGNYGAAVCRSIISLQTKIPLSTEDQKIQQALDACKKVAQNDY